MAGELDDATLMLGFRDGNVAAFETLYGRHKGGLYRYFLRQCALPEDAAQLLRDTWTRVIQAKDLYTLGTRFPVYAYQIAHKCLVDYQKKGPAAAADSGLHPMLVEEELPSPEDTMSRQFASGRWSLVDWEKSAGSASTAVASPSDRFRTALEKLPAEVREAFLLHEEAQLGIADIAIVTGAGAERVRAHLENAVRALGDAVEDEAALDGLPDLQA